MPMIFSGLDFILNLVLVELNLIVWNILLAAIYLIINYIYVKFITNKPIYPYMTWATP